MTRTKNPAALERGGVSHVAQLTGFEHTDLTAAKAEFQRTAEALHLEALSLSGGSQFAVLALSAHYRRKAAVYS